MSGHLYSKPFGELSCEGEKEALGEKWKDHFFEHAPFNQVSLDNRTYLIVGRRGSGKSSLAEYFKYQTRFKEASSCSLGSPRDYLPRMIEISKKFEGSTDLTIGSLEKVWEVLVWQVIYKHFSFADKKLSLIKFSDTKSNEISEIVRLVTKGVSERILGESGIKMIELLDEMLRDTDFVKARELVLEHSPSKPLFVTVDTREQYAVHNNVEMNITSALVQFAQKFNRDYSNKGLHIKVFLPDEIFPHLKEKYILNPAKFVQDELVLQWRPRDLVRLICWRYFKYLRSSGQINLREQDIDWENFDDVRSKMWNEYFGEYLENRNGLSERTLPYIIRHTQLRPRQLIMVCNKIAKYASDEGTLPYFSSDAIVEAVREVELDLADEVISSFIKVYKDVGDIASALAGFPMMFHGSKLDRVAHRTASSWTSEKYSPMRFRQLLSQLGIIGRVRREPDMKSGIVMADFEFAMRDRLFINESDLCVIHPMFYAKLNTQYMENHIILPFPNHPEWKMLLNEKSG